MPKFVSINRIHQALLNLPIWLSKVDSQGAKHLWHFLTAKYYGVNAENHTAFGEPDDRKFWDEFMRVRNTDYPYFDPLEADFRIATHYHSNVATTRKNTFANRWNAASYYSDNDRQEYWKFSDNYIEIISNKVLSKGGRATLVPVFDVIAWLYRTQQFDDDQTLEKVVDKFRQDFHISDREFKSIFSRAPIDSIPERAGRFFTDHVSPNELILEVTTNPQGFDLTEALIKSYPKHKMQSVKLTDVLELVSKGRKQVIFQGPPATGKTYLARQVTALLLGAENSIVGSYEKLSNFLHKRQLSRLPRNAWVTKAKDLGGLWDIIQFHPSYTYEDFVRGITPTLVEGQPYFRAENRIFGEIALLSQRLEVPIILIIDEINRGDLSKVMGELIYALEYRGESVRTPYEVDDSSLLSVGLNFYLLATMNTADRSIALIDYAIRRRFDFIELQPDRFTLEYHVRNSPNLVNKATRILALFDAISELFDNPDYAVGHAYFMGQNTEDIARCTVFQVLPLLNEYQKEGVLDESVALHLDGWSGTSGIPFTHPSPFRLADEIKTWLDGGEPLLEE